MSQVSVFFKSVPHSIFPMLTPEDLVHNILIFNIQPDEGITLTFQAKKPGPKLCMSPVVMDFKYSKEFGSSPPEAYERLLLDCMLGDQTLFIRHDGMELAWSLITPVLNYWKTLPADSDDGKLHFYPSGSWGPKSAQQLLERDGRNWIEM